MQTAQQCSSRPMSFSVYPLATWPTTLPLDATHLPAEIYPHSPAPTHVPNHSCLPQCRAVAGRLTAALPLQGRAPGEEEPSPGAARRSHTPDLIPAVTAEEVGTVQGNFLVPSGPTGAGWPQTLLPGLGMLYLGDELFRKGISSQWSLNGTSPVSVITGPLSFLSQKSG